MRRTAVLLALVLLLSLPVFPVSAAGDTVLPGPPPEYEDMFPVPEENVSLPVYGANTSVEGPLRGKSILFFGDSLTSGYGLSDYSQSWCGMLESRYGMQVTNHSIAGSTFATASIYNNRRVGGCYEPYVNRTLPNGTFDIIFVEGGGNDWYCAIPMEQNLDSRNPYTFPGAVNLVIDRLQEKYPKALIVFMTSWISPSRASDTYYTPERDYYEVMSQICARRSIPCFQARDPAISGIYATDTAFRSRYFLTTQDYWHLNAAGQALFLPTIASWLESQVLEHYIVGTFYDVPKKAWFAGAVAYTVQNGIFYGVDATHFDPNAVSTRSMFAATLYRAMGSPSVAGLSQPFADVPAGSWYRDAVVWCYHSGIVSGVGDDRFAPNEPLTRQDLIAILYRWTVSSRSGATDPEDASMPENLLHFTDCTEIAGYARAPMAWAVETGLISGMDAKTLAPTAVTSRAQLAAVLQRYLTAP